MPETHPNHAPIPRAVIGWDGTAYRVFAVDDHGRLQVRGEDQLHSYASNLLSSRTAIVSGAGGFCDSVLVPAGSVWHVTNISAMDLTSPTTGRSHDLMRGVALYNFDREDAALGAAVAHIWSGHIWFAANDFVRVWFLGSLLGDNCNVTLTGEIMTLET